MHSFSGNCAALDPIFHIHVSVSVLHIPRIDPHIFLQQDRQIDPGNIKIAYWHFNCRNWDCVRAIVFLGIFF
jgi:hypothetical protein